MLPGGIRQGTDCPEMLSALGNRPVGGARGGKRGAIAPPTLCKLVGSLGGCAAGQGAFCSLAHLPRGGGAQDPLHLSRQHFPAASRVSALLSPSGAGPQPA